MVLEYLFDSIEKEDNKINITLRYLLLRIINKKLSKKKVLFNYFDKS